MGLFSRSKKKTEATVNKRSAELTVSNHERLTAKAARISFDIPAEATALFAFTPGQYLNLHCAVNGNVLNRSYSICSAPGEPLSVAVKAVEGGVASNWLVNELAAGTSIEVDFPHGNFGLQKGAKKHVAFAAGSGITPFLSMAKSIEGTDHEIRLFYGNQSQSETFFANELNSLNNAKTTYYFSREEVTGHQKGRFDKQTVSEIIKADLSLLRAEAFYVCGPEAMIIAVKEVLEVFGIKPEQIHFELFTTPVLMKAPETISTAAFSGESTVSAILDGEVTTIKLNTKGKTVLEALDATGMDVPYSCKGGVCCTCKAKILEGSASMKINYALTDEEVKEGYVLTCQAHPTSEILKLDFDV